jgi:hypothetical protein
MPRGRHRQSSPLSRLLPPIAGALAAVVALALAMLGGDRTVLRAATALAAVAALATRRRRTPGPRRPR